MSVWKGNICTASKYKWKIQIFTALKHVLCEASMLYPLDTQDHTDPVLLLWECGVLGQHLLTTDRLCQRNHHVQNNG